MVHILLLVQTTSNPKTREWAEFSCVNDCCDHVCKMFEDGLKKSNPFESQIHYDIADLYAFVDNVSREFSSLISFRFS